MQIAVQQAAIKTAAVEIKALTVSGKQVTLAVFRQLDQKPLLDYETRKLNGVAWGRVNYHPDKCADHADHVHVVWQGAEYLYRDVVYLGTPGESYRTESVMKSRFELDEYADWVRDTEQRYLISCFWHGAVTLDTSTTDYKLITPQLRFPDSFLLKYRTLNDWSYCYSKFNPDTRHRELSEQDAIRKWLKSTIPNFEFDKTPEVLWSDVQKAVKDYENQKTVVEKATAFHKSTYKLLEQLDLLFIAV